MFETFTKFWLLLYLCCPLKSFLGSTSHCSIKWKRQWSRNWSQSSHQSTAVYIRTEKKCWSFKKWSTSNNFLAKQKVLNFISCSIIKRQEQVHLIFNCQNLLFHILPLTAIWILMLLFFFPSRNKADISEWLSVSLSQYCKFY